MWAFASAWFAILPFKREVCVQNSKYIKCGKDERTGHIGQNKSRRKRAIRENIVTRDNLWECQRKRNGKYFHGLFIYYFIGLLRYIDIDKHILLERFGREVGICIFVQKILSWFIREKSWKSECSGVNSKNFEIFRPSYHFNMHACLYGTKWVWIILNWLALAHTHSHFKTWKGRMANKSYCTAKNTGKCVLFLGSWLRRRQLFCLLPRLQLTFVQKIKICV